jgi:hypothetical protein
VLPIISHQLNLSALMLGLIGASALMHLPVKQLPDFVCA